ncbi:hypothetical protein BD410DRAFT_876471, partial [Rickenella mellea]
SLRFLRIYPRKFQGTNLLELIDILVLCPELIEFAFHDDFSASTSIHWASERTIITLPRLRRFSISGNTNASICLLNRLSIPHDASLSMIGPYVEIFPPSPSPSIPQPFVAVYDSLKVILSTSVQVKAETNPPSTCTGDAYSEVNDRKTLDLDFTGLELRTLPHVLGNLFHQLRHLELNDVIEYCQHVGSWIAFFSSLYELKTLKITFISSSSATTLMDAFSESKSGYGQLCPSLRSITYQGITFEGPGGDIISSKLASFLQKRDNSSTRLEMLDISGCRGISSEALQLLQPHVHTLYVPEERLPT